MKRCKKYNCQIYVKDQIFLISKMLLQINIKKDQNFNEKMNQRYSLTPQIEINIIF